MTHKIRQSLFSLFVIAFFLITPLISLYAAGYKIKLSWPLNFKQTLSKTGMLVIDTSPRGAKIFIDDKPSQLFFKKYFNKSESYIKTPAKIKNIMPGEYTIRVESPGYWSWEKKLTINPGQATYAEDIYLFKNDMPMQMADLSVKEENFSRMPIREASQSPNKKYFFSLNEEKAIITPENEEQTIIPFSSLKKPIKNPFSILWSNDSEKIIVGKILFNIHNPEKIIYLEDILGTNADNFFWDKTDANKIYYQADKSIGYLDLATNIKKTLLSGEEYLDYLPGGDNLYFISQANAGTRLKEFSLKSQTVIKNIELPSSLGYEFMNPQNGFLNIYDSKHNILYLADPSLPANPLKEIINNTEYAYWVNNNKLLYGNDFEIWLLDLDNANSLTKTNKKILTRISQPIGAVLWHPSDNYVFFHTDKTINIIELDERERRNVTELLKTENIYSLFLDEKGETLYFGAKIGNQEGLYKLEIQ
jgi:hypothetical protein